MTRKIIALAVILAAGNGWAGEYDVKQSTTLSGKPEPGYFEYRMKGVGGPKEPDWKQDATHPVNREPGHLMQVDPIVQPKEPDCKWEWMEISQEDPRSGGHTSLGRTPIFRQIGFCADGSVRWREKRSLPR